MTLLKRPINFLLAIALVFSLNAIVFASDVTVPTKPDDYYVYDMADVINDTTAEEISLLNTDELAGYGEIVIVTIDSSGDTSLADYTEELFEAWEIGGSTAAGALLVMEIDGDNYRSIVGAGFSSYISESQLQDILDGQVEYYFDATNYASAASIFASAISSKIIIEDSTEVADGETADETADDTTEEAVEETTDEEQGSTFAKVLFTIFKALLIIILILLIIVVGFLILVNIRSKKKKNSRRSRRNNRG